MKKNPLLYVSIALLLIAAAFQVYPLFAYTGTPITATASVPCSNGQLLMATGTTIGCIPNSFAGNFGTLQNVNFGTSSQYAHVSGFLNTYDVSTSSPILSASFMCKTSAYCQTFLQNLDPTGSADLVWADDKGSASSTDHYGDAGIANSQQVDPDHTAILPYALYFYNQSGPMIVGTATTSASSSFSISMGMATNSPAVTIDRYGHIITHGAKPTLTGSATCSLSATSNDNSGTVTCTGLLSITNLVLTFAGPYQATEVQCTLMNKNNITLGGYTSSVTSVTMPTTVGLGGGSFTYQCQASI